MVLAPSLIFPWLFLWLHPTQKEVTSGRCNCWCSCLTWQEVCRPHTVSVAEIQRRKVALSNGLHSHSFIILGGKMGVMKKYLWNCFIPFDSQQPLLSWQHRKHCWVKQVLSEYTSGRSWSQIQKSSAMERGLSLGAGIARLCLQKERNSSFCFVFFFFACSYVPPYDLRPTFGKKKEKKTPPFIFQHARILPLCRYCTGTLNPITDCKAKSSHLCSVWTKSHYSATRTPQTQVWVWKNNPESHTSSLIIFFRIISKPILFLCHIHLLLLLLIRQVDLVTSTES